MKKDFFEKLSIVMNPVNQAYWKAIQEDIGGMVSASAACGGGMGSMGAAPCPAIGQITGGGVSGVLFNGVPVEGVSANKKKKKKSSKNENFLTRAELDAFANTIEKNEIADALTENPEVAKFLNGETEELPEGTTEISTEEALAMETRGLIVQAQAEENQAIKSYLDKALECEKRGLISLAKLFKELADDETVHTGCLQSALDNLGLSDLDNVLDGQEEADQIFQQEYDEEMEQTVESLLNEDFHEEYDEITAQIAKYLDKLNFKYANTDDIIYKKEGEYKYLFKFDNGIGEIKVKVQKDKDVLAEKTYKIDTTSDIQPIFDKITELYNQYGL